MGSLTEAIAALQAEVDRNETVDGSASVLINKLAGLIEANKADPVALQTLVDKLRASNDSLASAVSANTPSE